MYRITAFQDLATPVGQWRILPAPQRVWFKFEGNMLAPQTGV
jgi:hypothetical protein